MAQIKNIKKPGDLIRGAKVGVAGLDKDGNVISIQTADVQAGYVSYLTTPPESVNTDGLKFVVLTSEPMTKYNGYIYIITGASS